MAGSIYPSYPPLLSGAAELLGTGVACVAGGAATGTGPSQTHHLAHYQRLLEMQKEAYLASMSAAASHHTAIYGIGSSALPQFLDQTTVSCHGPTPLSLVKQEPKESSCAEKTNKQSEKRAASYKFDTDPNRGNREASCFSTLTGSLISAQLREPKLSPSSSVEVHGRLDKKGNFSSSSRGSNSDLHKGKRTPTNSSVNSYSTSTPRNETAPNRPTQPASSGHSAKRTSNGNSALSSNCKRGGVKSSGNMPNRLQMSATGNPIVTSSPLLSEPPIISVPTHAASPIPLATVQLDGIVLSALATPSSAAASSFSTKAIIHNQQSERLNRTTVEHKGLRDGGKYVAEANTSSGLSQGVIDTTLNCDHGRSASHAMCGISREVIKKTSTSISNGAKTVDQTEDSKLLSDDSCDIIVDSTEKNDTAAPVDSSSITKSETDTSIEETIYRIASAVDTDVDSDRDDLTPQTCVDTEATNTSLLCVTRVETTCVVTPSGTSSSGTRTVYSKTQPVLSVAVSGNIPVGIAVAQIRPHHVQQTNESHGPENLARESRHIHTSLNTKTITTAATALAAPAAALAPNLVVTGPTVNQSPWLQQMPFPIHQALNSSGTAFDPSFPITAPSGFKLAHDSLSGRLFLIPSGDFVEQGGVWPSPAFAQPTEAGNSHYQTPLNPPTVTLNGTEKREGKPTEDSTVKNSSPVNTADRIIPTPETISKDVAQLTKDDGKHQPPFGGSNSAPFGLTTATTSTPTIMVNPVTNVNPIAPSILVKMERPTVESRGCSPVMFEDISSPLSLLSTLSCLTSEKPKTCSVGVQTCDSLMKSICNKMSSSHKLFLQDQGVQTLSQDFTTFNPLSVQCPDLDCADPLAHCLEKSHLDRASYNPFTDPQILQAADGLELLSTLAEKRPKCSSIDDPKRIFPSPSDSFKSDSASLVAIEDTLSPGDIELKSGQCTPRREIRRDLSPKWSLPKKESQIASVLGDFKTPTEMEISEDSEMRVKLAEVQRQYKEKQKELAKLQIKKSEESKQSNKRGPGRPPKKKAPSKKSDDESSSSSSKTKEHPHQHKKKRPEEELVDRVFRKLPPVIKPSKVSRSIHYVKSKTGPFFRRKSASSSVKRNKDLFGFDESNWPSFSEGKHQEKVKDKCSSPDKSKSRHRSNSSHSEDSKHSQDVGNIFTNLESFGGEYVDQTVRSPDYVERRRRPSKCQSQKHEKSTTPDMIVIKTELNSPTSQQESGLGLLAKFALNGSSLTTTTFSTTSAGGSHIVTPTVCSFSSNTFSTIAGSSSSVYGNGSYNGGSTPNSSSCSYSPNIGFGSVGNFMSSSASCVMSFNSPSLAASILNSSTPNVATSSTFALLSSSSSLSSTTTSLAASAAKSTSSSLAAVTSFSSQEIHQAVMKEFSSGMGTSTCSSIGTTSISAGMNVINNCLTTSSVNSTVNDATNSLANSITANIEDTSPNKRSVEEDSDTDASETSPNKKRKPGRPRKINPENSSCGTETIWAKKSTNIGLLQTPESSCSQSKDEQWNKADPAAVKPLFLDEEWTRRRSERIFLSEPSPQPSPALSPAPRGEPVWKLSNFMPKSKKLLDVNKSIKDSDTSKDGQDSTAEPTSPVNVAMIKSSLSTMLTSTANIAVKTEGKESISKMAPLKSVEISTVKVEDAKKIVKLEDAMPSLPLLPLSVKIKKSSKTELDKKKIVKKKDKPDETPTTTTPSPPNLDMKERRAEENSKIKLQKAKSLHDLTQRVKKKFSKAGIKKQDDLELNKLSKPRQKKRKISTDSSDTDNLPLVSYRVIPPAPEPRSCKLQQSDLREGLKVLYLIDGLFHEGTVKALQPPDVYGVLTAGQRGNRPHILCLEEILKWAVLDVKPGSVRYLSEGTRICAFWSQQFSCLYPGTVAKSNPNPVSSGKKLMVSVEFDDGDNGRIELDHIRLLPSDFPVVEYEPDPLESLPKRKQRSTSDASDRRKSVDNEPRLSRQSKDDVDKDDENDGSSDDSDSDNNDRKAAVGRETWRWDGKSTKRPGLKGKAKKIFYKAITRGKETIRVGDSAIFVSKERINCPYIGHIESLWEGWNGQMMVKVQWYYHPEETESNKKLADPKNALFESQHEDENDVQTIAHKCEVLSYSQYKKRVSNASKKGTSLKPKVFFVAGFYDPAAKNVTFHPGVS